ncbi:uracil-DNA glycosylase [Bifidobacterium gallicum]|nr:uracil-DNA glycosylase [Bifidobacterium gallicum]
MSTPAIKPLHELMDPGWAQALAPVEPQIHHMGDFLRDQVAQGHHFLPAAPNILRAFRIPFNSVKVLIVGQDPYPTPGHPVGLSFSTAPDVHPLPKSLINIYKELQSDLGIEPAPTGDLTPWTKQGVMLLNRCLTVEAGKPNSHQGKGWEPVTEAAIRALNNRTDEHGNLLPLVAILWGRNAQSLAPLLTNATIIASPHPSPLSASRGFFGSRPFSRANEALKNAGATPVDWRLQPTSHPQPLQSCDGTSGHVRHGSSSNS